MPVTDTPLRYPGGKSQMAPLVIQLLKKNELSYGEYAEPFAGGSGIAMTLLLRDLVSKIYINDIDKAIHDFWASVLRHADDLCELVESVPVTIEERTRQRAIFLGETTANIVQRGFATLFLSRTNRSGILRGGVIGGRDQTGNYKLDCRFNREDLVRKIRRIADHRHQISLSRLDAKTFLDTIVPATHAKTLVNLDPPYFVRGPELYTNYYQPQDHQVLARAVGSLRRRWIVTYDDATAIRNLYARYPTYRSSLQYYAQEKRAGSELLIVDPRLAVPRGFGLARLRHKPCAD